MNLAFFIARRYFLSKKKKSFINVISIISMLVVAIGTMALIIVLSVFNGLEGMLRSLYGTVDPNLVVMASEGKSFESSDALIKQIGQTEGVAAITEVLEDNVLMRYDNAQRIAHVKGVSENFVEQDRLKEYLVFGDLKLRQDGIDYAIVGRGVQYDLSINPKNDFYTIQMYFPDKIGPGVTNPDRMYRSKNILPGGVFAVEKTYDENLVYVPLHFAEDLFDKHGKRNSMELQVTPGTDLKTLKQTLQTKIGPDYKVLSNEELHGDLYRVLSYEKFFVFLVFTIIIGIASINIFFSLSMLAIDKKKDISILVALGASSSIIRNIFFIEGCIVAFTGAFTGLSLGLIVCYIQHELGLVTMGMETALLDAYPIDVVWTDVMYTVIAMVIITVITAIQPARSASKNLEMNEL